MGVELQHLFLEVVYYKTLGVVSPETQIVVFWGFQLCSELDSNNTCFESKISFWNSKKPSRNLFWRTTLEEQHLFWNSQFSCASCLCHPELFCLLWLAKATPIVHDILFHYILYTYHQSCVFLLVHRSISPVTLFESAWPRGLQRQWVNVHLDRCFAHGYANVVRTQQRRYELLVRRSVWNTFQLNIVHVYRSQKCLDWGHIFSIDDKRRVLCLLPSRVCTSEWSPICWSPRGKR